MPRMTTKREMIEQALEVGTAAIYVNAQLDGVDVPEVFKERNKLILALSKNFEHDAEIELDAAGVHATLSFGGVRHRCNIPWSAIYCVFEAKAQGGYVFPADAPPDVLKELQAASKPPPPTVHMPRGKPNLRLVH